MVLTAALEALQAISGPVEVRSDSKYVVDCLNAKWFVGWEAKGWKTASKQPVKNRDLLRPLVELFHQRGDELTFTWVKGYSEDPMNDIVDRLAVQAATEQAPRSGTGIPTALMGSRPFANYLYAGLITAGCRTMVPYAIATHPQQAASVVMVATDAVFFTNPHPGLNLSDSDLGAWSHGLENATGCPCSDLCQRPASIHRPTISTQRIATHIQIGRLTLRSMPDGQSRWDLIARAIVRL